MVETTYITNINQFATLARAKPQLLSIGALRTLKEILNKSVKPIVGGCSKCGKASSEDLSTYRPQFDAAMALLSPTEQNQLKAMLDTKQICYYRKNLQGQLKKECF